MMSSFFKKEIKTNKEKNEKLVKKLKSDIISNLDIQNCVITAVKNYLEAKKGLLKEQKFEYAFLLNFVVLQLTGGYGSCIKVYFHHLPLWILTTKTK